MLARLTSLASLAAAVTLVACSGADGSVPDDGPLQANAVVTNPTDPSAATSNDAGSAPVADPTVHALANLGDSISQGFDADDSNPIDIGALKQDPSKIFHDNPSLSWIQGTDARIGSVREHFTKLDPSLVVTPFSRSGSELVRDLLPQAQEIGHKGAKPDLVYVLLGGNDVCNRQKSTSDDPTEHLYSVSEWTQAAERGLDELARNLPEGATVRFLSMPRVDFLYDALQSRRVPVKLDTPAGPITAQTTCKDLWSITAQVANGICQIVTTEADAAKRAKIGDRIDQYNDALAASVRKYDADANLNPKRIHFQSEWHGSIAAGSAVNSSVGTYKFTPDEVSRLDCFHPSIVGQTHIAAHVLTKARWNP